MTVALPDDVADAIARIDTPADDAVRVRPGLTGELALLGAWWARLTGDAPVVASYITVDAEEDLAGAQAADSACALSAGVAAANRAVDAGATLLVPRVAQRADPSPTDGDSSDDIVARALIGLLTRRDASSVLGQPIGFSDVAWMADCARIRDTMAEHRGRLSEQLSLLDAINGHSIAAASGVLIGAAARRTPCLIDGTPEWAAALVADRIAHRARHWWRASSTSTDPGRTAARDRTDIAHGLTLDLDDDEGWGSRVTVALLEMVRGTRD
jgi:hypothetical protein